VVSRLGAPSCSREPEKQVANSMDVGDLPAADDMPHQEGYKQQPIGPTQLYIGRQLTQKGGGGDHLGMC
jgi:hypothetical protein